MERTEGERGERVYVDDIERGGRGGEGGGGGGGGKVEGEGGGGRRGGGRVGYKRRVIMELRKMTKKKCIYKTMDDYKKKELGGKRSGRGEGWRWRKVEEEGKKKKLVVSYGSTESFRSSGHSSKSEKHEDIVNI